MTCEEHQLEMERANITGQLPGAETSQHRITCSECRRYGEILNTSQAVLSEKLSEGRAAEVKRKVLGLRDSWQNWIGYALLAAGAFGLTFVIKWTMDRPLGADLPGLFALSVSGPLAAGFANRRRALHVGALTTTEEFFTFYRHETAHQLVRMRAMRWATLAMTLVFTTLTVAVSRTGHAHDLAVLMRLGVVMALGSATLLVWTTVRIVRIGRLLATLAA